MKTQKITEFFDNDYVLFSVYDNYRKLASVVDGLKPSSRKVVYTMLKNNIKEKIKVSTLGSKVIGETSYLHGEKSMYDVIVGLAQDFVGANNINLILPEASFGFRHNNEASEARYIFTCKSPIMDKLFLKEDNDVLIQQTFEGEKIEPRFFVPTLPILLINGSEGIGNGYAQKILPRNPENLKKWIEKYLKDGTKDSTLLIPYYSGFKGDIIQTGEKSFSIIGKVDVLSQTELMITEIPLNYDLEKYVKVLNTLEEKGVIKSYTDLSDSKKDTFKFHIKCDRKFTQQTKEKILDDLKLIQKVTENYTCLNEHNRVETFESVEDILERYISIKLEYMFKRKEAIIGKIKREVDLLEAKYRFIELIIKGKIEVNGKSKQYIVDKIEELLPSASDKTDILLSMPIWSLTPEKQEELLKSLKKLAEEYKEYKDKSLEDMWKEEIDGIK
jgi:DNA topoisomerase-2